MKIYKSLVFSLETGDIIEEKSFEYEGIVTQCKGGGSSTTSVDKAYNKRMAKIAEAQQEMAEEYFNYYKYGSGHYIERTWIPDEGAIGLQQLEQEQIKTQMGLLPEQTALAKRHIGLTGQYFDEIAKGVDVRGEMGKAKTDVQQAYSGAEGAMRRSAGHMGINPASGRYAGMQSRMQLDKAKSLAGAGTMARRYAEEKQFGRLRGAMGGQ